MITKIPSHDRYRADHGWLTSYHLFSFADYYDPENMHFGALRVFNDDTIAGKNGFGPHPHRDMEIITIVYKGELTHEDSMGNKKVIREGEVQYMSAGTGVIHSELNHGNKEVHLHQIWCTPTSLRLTPAYDQRDFSQNKKNALVSVVSGDGIEDAIHIKSNVTIYQAEYEKGTTETYSLREGKGLFIYVMKGTLEVNGTILEEDDQARITEEKAITINVQEPSKFIAIEVGL